MSGFSEMGDMEILITPEGTLNYTYDLAGNVASIYSSSLNGASMAYTYDTLNRLSTVVDNNLPADSNATIYAYDTASNLVTVTYPNKLQSTIQYDSLNRLTSLNTATTTSSTPVSSYSYQLGATGNRTGATEQTGRTLTWNYDGIYRLTSEAVQDPSGGNGEVDYTLDPVDIFASGIVLSCVNFAISYFGEVKVRTRNGIPALYQRPQKDETASAFSDPSCPCADDHASSRIQRPPGSQSCHSSRRQRRPTRLYTSHP